MYVDENVVLGLCCDSTSANNLLFNIPWLQFCTCQVKFKLNKIDELVQTTGINVFVI